MEESIYENPQLASHRQNFLRCMKEGNSYRHAGEYDQALKHFSEARQHAYKLLSARPLVLSRCYLFIADVHQLKGKYDRAAGCYEKAIRYAVMDRKIGKNHEHVAWLRARAKACRRQIPGHAFVLPSSLIQLALEIALADIELGGAIAAGFFAIRVAKALCLAGAMRER